MALAKWYTSGPAALATDVSWTTDTIKVALVNGYTPNQDTHTTYSNLTGALATANGYTARGATLASKTANTDAGTNQTRLDAADVSWTPGAGQTLTATHAIVYKDTGSDATSKLLGYVDFEGEVSATNDAFSITWDSTGVLRIDAAA